MSGKSHFRKAFPYAKDAMNLPVRDLDAAIPFYQTVMGFELVSRQDAPVRSAVLHRDDVQIGLAENDYADGAVGHLVPQI